MESLNAKEKTIFKCAENLFKTSQEIKSIDSELSNIILFLSDRLLKTVEEPQSNSIENVVKITNDHIQNETFQKTMQNDCKECCDMNRNDSSDKICPDCGGIKRNDSSDKICPDCGGIKRNDSSDNINLQSNEEQCCSHQNDQNNNNRQQINHSSKIKNEINSLIEEIRKGM